MLSNYANTIVNRKSFILMMHVSNSVMTFSYIIRFAEMFQKILSPVGVHEKKEIC